MAAPPIAASTSARIVSSDMPGNGRPSTSAIASEGITLMREPAAWRIVGLTVLCVTRIEHPAHAPIHRHAIQLIEMPLRVEQGFEIEGGPVGGPGQGGQEATHRWRDVQRQAGRAEPVQRPAELDDAIIVVRQRAVARPAAGAQRKRKPPFSPVCTP